MKGLIAPLARPRSAVLLVLLAHAGALLAQPPQQQAWNILRAGVNDKSTGKRTQAVRALRLLPVDPEASEMAQRALQDQKPEVRVAAANALGLMGSRVSIPGLKKALSDRKPSVVLAAAHALQVLNDPAGYQIYYEVLTGERKSADGLVTQEMKTLKDGKKMAELGFEEGLGLIPFADMGFSAAKAIRKDDTSPVRAAAAKALVDDLDPRIWSSPGPGRLGQELDCPSLGASRHRQTGRSRTPECHSTGIVGQKRSCALYRGRRCDQADHSCRAEQGCEFDEERARGRTAVQPDAQ